MKTFMSYPCRNLVGSKANEWQAHYDAACEVIANAATPDCVAIQPMFTWTTVDIFKFFDRCHNGHFDMPSPIDNK